MGRVVLLEYERNIAWALWKSGLTQSMIARLLGCSRQTIWREIKRRRDSEDEISRPEKPSGPP